jgi:hypothetical protein
VDGVRQLPKEKNLRNVKVGDDDTDPGTNGDDERRAARAWLRPSHAAVVVEEC